MTFYKGTKYTRNQVWQQFHPSDQTKPRGGSWDTGYVTEGAILIAFLNIDSAGRTGHDFDNAYDSESEVLTWFGKPSTRSDQPTFKKLFAGDLKPIFFARWNNKDTQFVFLGEGKILSFKDGVPIQNSKTAIRLEVALNAAEETIGPEGIVDVVQPIAMPSYAKKLQSLVNRYERDPLKRDKCLSHYGHVCQICTFSFCEVYGELGRDFCHVHHIEPLSEVGGEHDIDPIKDLIPVCPNCHAMLHRRTPALKPHELRELLKK